MLFASVDHLPFMMQGADASLSLEQRFPLSRIRGNRGRVAEAESQRLLAEADRVEFDVELDAASAFLMLSERRQTARVLDEQRTLSKQFVRAATARYAAGTGGQADVLRAEIEVARLEGSLRSIEAEVRAAEAMLATSLGRPATAPIPALDSGVSLSLPPTVDAAREAALKGRPELRAGRAEIGRASAEVSVMHSMSAPMAMVRAGPAYTMFDGPGVMFMFGISLPVWRGRLRAGVAEAESMVAMAQADLQAMSRMVEGDAVAAREQVVASRERLLALRDDIVPRARHAIEPTLSGYASGQLPLVSVIEAALTLRALQGELISAELNLGIAWARLHRAMADEGARRP